MLGGTPWLSALVFGALCAFSLYLALRRDRFRRRQPRPTWVWAAAVSALALGASVGGALQDGRLAGQLAASQLERERLEAELGAARAQGSVAATAPSEAPLPIPAPSVRAVVPPISERAAPEPATPAPTLLEPAPTITEPTATAPTVTEPITTDEPEPTATDEPITTELTATEPMTTDEPINTDVPTTTELTTTQPTAVEPTAVEPTATQLTATQPTAADLSGSWVLRTITEETTHQPFLGLELTFELTVSETSSGVVATGEKVAERLPGAGLRTYAPAARTSIALTGTFVEDDGLRIRFTEEGAVRPSSGEMLLRQVAESRFEGRFSSEAGGAAGRVVLERAQAASR